MKHNLRPVVVAALVVGLGLAFGAAAQDRLSDAAKGLSLDHPESERILVSTGEDTDTGSGIDVTGPQTVELGERALATGRTAESVLGETRSQDLFYDPAWRARMLEACADLDVMSRSLALVRPPSRFAAAFDTVVEGARRYRLAGDVIRRAITQDEPLYGGAFDGFAAAGRDLLAGLVELRLELEREESAQPSLPLDHYGVHQTCAALCALRSGGQRDAGYNGCMERQMGAFDAINRRFGFSVGLDEATFNSIRAGCRRDWPEDLVARNSCELARSAAAK